MWHIGLDVHLRTSSLHILDANGKKVKARTVRGGWDRLIETLRGLRDEAPPGGMAICYEASCGYGHLHDRLSRIARRVVVAHPGQLRLIFRSKRKHDRVDAAKLAKLLFLDEAPSVWVPKEEARAWRRLIEHRNRLIAKRTRCKNGLRTLLRTHGIDAPAGKRLWTKKGRAYLTDPDLPGRDDELHRDILLEDLDHAERQVKRVTKRLDEILETKPGVALLRTIPGVGPRTAEAVAAYIDDPKRFPRNKAIGAYFGLIPCEDSSAARHRLGHITREGPATVRKMVVEAAWQAIRHSPTVRAYYQRIMGGKAERRKIALVATAHYLLRAMLAMLQSGEAWREAEPERAAA